MQLTFLGTGTSHGVPIIGCKCAVCKSTNPKNRRYRSSILIKASDTNLLFDTTPEFRLQAIENNIEKVNAVFLTHAHADHIFGFDDLRRFCEIQNETIPVYGSAATMDYMKKAFHYVANPSYSLNAVPRVELIEQTETIEINGVKISAIPVSHGKLIAQAYKIDDGKNSIVYAPDCNRISDESFAEIGTTDIMILDALRPEKHPTHFNIDESINALQRINAKQSFLTHLTHNNEHEALQKTLPQNIHVAYDGLQITI